MMVGPAEIMIPLSTMEALSDIWPRRAMGVSIPACAESRRAHSAQKYRVAARFRVSSTCGLLRKPSSAVDGERQHGEHYGECELCLQVVVEAHEHNTQAHDPDELGALGVVDAVACEEGQLHGDPLIGPSSYVHEEGVGPGDEGAGDHRQHGDRPQRQVHDE